MTPAISLLRKKRIAHTVHEYEHDPSAESYGLEAAQKLGVEPDRMFKTLVVRLDSKQLAVGIVPVSAMLNMKLMAKACGARSSHRQSTGQIERKRQHIKIAALKSIAFQHLLAMSPIIFDDRGAVDIRQF